MMCTHGERVGLNVGSPVGLCPSPDHPSLSQPSLFHEGDLDGDSVGLIVGDSDGLTVGDMVGSTSQ